MLARRFEWKVALTLGALLGGAAVSAQVIPTQQVLDRVNAVSPKAVLEMAFEDPALPTPFEIPPAIQTSKGFSACQLTATKGLFCLDKNNGNPGRWVRKWLPVAAAGETTPYYFSCEDSVLALDKSKGAESCTGITADDQGGVVIAGKRKGGYNLIKVVAKSVLDDLGIACSSTNTTWRPLALTPNLCRKILLPRDRPLLVDITYTKLTFAGGMTCTGILGLETRTALMFFKDPDVADEDADGNTICSPTLAPVLIADGSAWGLSKNPKEVLQGATVMKFPDNGHTFALVVSSLGRVLAKRTDVTGQAPFQLQLLHSGDTTAYPNLTELRDSRAGNAFDPGLDPAACQTVLPQKYGTRTSTKSGSLYITDQDFCEVTALKPASTTLSDSNTQGLRVAEFTGRDLVLATKLYDTNAAETTYPPLEPTLAPGISIDLSKCAGTTGCTLVADDSGGRAATLSQVLRAGSAKGMTVFWVKNNPDCRWFPNPKPAICEEPGVILNPDDPPEKQFQNVAATLPEEVKNQFPSGFFDSRPMYLSPEYRAQVTAYPDNPLTPENDPHPPRYYFDYFFFVPEPGVYWKDTFLLELDIGRLTGDELGCVASYPTATWPIPLTTLLRWDAGVTISEFVQVVGGPPDSDGLSYTDILLNSGCGSLLLKGSRGSSFMFDLEFTPTVYAHTPAENANNPPDDYFAHVVVDLFYDLKAAQDQTACNTGGPLASIGTVCADLTQAWLNAKDKLNKCITGSNYPKQSEAVRNCNSFNNQLDNYVAILNALPLLDCNDPESPTCYDPENRSGELEAREAAIRHAYNDRLLPSVPLNGFQFPKYEGYGGVLPLP